MNETTNSTQKSKRDNLSPNMSIPLTNCGTENTRTFEIIESLGDGGTVIAYKVKYDSADTNKYMYVLKEVYPMPTKKFGTLERGGTEGRNLNIDRYSADHYKHCRHEFEKAYHLQNELVNSNNKVLNISTSLPIGLYEDRNSSKKGLYSLYGLFQYYNGETLNNHKEGSLLELIDIQRKVVEVVKAYHNMNYLWLDIKETNINIVGEGNVQTVSMFDFGSLISMKDLAEYTYDGTEPKFFISFSRTSNELLLPFELECLMNDSCNEQSDNIFILTDPMNVAQSLNILGLYGRGTDIFLLGSLFFKRLYGYAPTAEICNQIQKGSFDINSSSFLKTSSDKVKKAIYEILKKTLNYEDIEKRYELADELVEAYNFVHKLINIDMIAKGLEDNIKQAIDWYSDKYNMSVLTSENGKFARLRALSDRRFKNFVVDEANPEKSLTPFEAIESDRLVFFYGDGGIGKSISMFDYMKKSTAITIYIELSRYKYSEDEENFIIRTIINEICNNFADCTGYDKNSYDFARKLKDSFLQCTTGIPEYTIILDGYNEISDTMRGYFDYEIGNLYNDWQNVHFIVTSRTIPVDIDGKEEKKYVPFRKFKFVGVPDEELKTIIKTTYPETFKKIFRDKKLYEVLHIPMFLGMFLNLQVDIDDSVHTRGEILDKFITKTERDVAEHIAGNQYTRTDFANKRILIVCYSLTFVGNYMDKNHTFSVSESELFELITEGNVLYLVRKIGENSISVYECYLNKKISKESIGFDDRTYKITLSELKEENPKISLLTARKRAIQDIITSKMILHILLNETGYCYLADDGTISFTHQYFRDYFAAKHIQNILDADQTMGTAGLSKDEQLKFTQDNGISYFWSDDVCTLLGEIIGDYKNEPGYTEE